ncbi:MULTISPECIES: peroxide stress protein YaaA [Vitreoscilla]|uniref:UPF0246 protein LVJ81_02190 n=1 Tax=Vitreoscilla stercoraria TaxID=61 RepID=A0ABY4EEI9_VITST|nr:MULTISPECIES: peroxide stress protein YaaA [Vitreoscilla]UOO93681.1 peroxide stress protein YaaA [Vitreoscilla stercoraria]
MYYVISPAKNLDEATPVPVKTHSSIAFADDTQMLMDVLQTLSPQDIAKLMGVSDKIARLNVERNGQFQLPITLDNGGKQALFLFKGDVYEGMDAYHLAPEALAYLQERLGLLSGLYGLLRPLDLMQAYRLEMGTALKNPRGDNLYQFWGKRITALLNERMAQAGATALVNLASQEYFKSVQERDVNVPIITPVFKDEKNGQYKIISFYAKRARGLMVKYASERQIQNVEDLKQFDLEGYQYCEVDSNSNTWVFKRPEGVK